MSDNILDPVQRRHLLIWAGAGGLFLLFLGILVLFPQIDIATSGLFYQKDLGFWARDWGIVHGLNLLAVDGARVLGILLLLGALLAKALRRVVMGLDAKAWLFLFVALVVGPGLVANVTFKDHWGRARPRDSLVFGGTQSFTPALYISDACRKNCSFVAGDGAFGFYLPCLAYVVVASRRRRFLGGTMLAGSVFALARLVAGAHFLSDILFAFFFMQLTNAGVYAAFYGKRQMLSFWKSILLKKT